MAITLANTRTRLKTLLEAITGVTKAFAYTPRNVQEADCPCFLIVPAEADHDNVTPDLHRVMRRWRLILLIGKAGTGIYGDLEKALDPFYERVEDKFEAEMQLDELDSEVIHALIDEDSGQGTIEFPPESGNKWVGCEWALLITTKRVVTTGL